MRWVAWVVLLAAQDAPSDAEKLERKVKALTGSLRQARTSADPEVRDRAGRVLAELERPSIQSRDDVEAIVLEMPAQETSVRRVTEALARLGRVQVLYTARLEDSGILDAEVELPARSNLGLARMLDRLCQDLRLAWTVKSGCILIDLSRPADYGKINIKFYDVQTLIAAHRDDGMRPTSLVDMMACGREGRIPSEERPSTFTADDLVSLLIEVIDPEVWEDSDLYYINLMNSNAELVISAPEETHKKIRSYLQGIHRFIHRQWEAKVWMISLPASRAMRLPEELGTLQWESLRRLALEGKEASLLGTFRLMGLPEQRVSCISGTSHTIVRSYAPDGQPDVAEITDGVKIWITASPDDSGKTLADVVISSSKVNSIEKISTKRGEISLAEMSHAEIRVRRHFSQNTPVVLARMPAGGGSKDAVVFVATFASFVPE